MIPLVHCWESFTSSQIFLDDAGIFLLESVKKKTSIPVFAVTLLNNCRHCKYILSVQVPGATSKHTARLRSRWQSRVPGLCLHVAHEIRISQQYPGWMIRSSQFLKRLLLNSVIAQLLQCPLCQFWCYMCSKYMIPVHFYLL
jgi:hypothetical protein